MSGLAPRTVALRRYWLSVAGAALVALAISLPPALIGYFRSTDTAATVAQLSASSEVGQRVTRNIDDARAHLRDVNAARTDAGLASIPDPGPNATANEIDGAWSAGLGDLLTLGTLQAKGVPVPGVRAPDPAGRFPWVRSVR